VFDYTVVSIIKQLPIFLTSFVIRDNLISGCKILTDIPICFQNATGMPNGVLTGQSGIYAR